MMGMRSPLGVDNGRPPAFGHPDPEHKVTTAGSRSDLEHIPISKRRCHPGISRSEISGTQGEWIWCGISALGPGSRADARGRDDSATGATGSVRSECALTLADKR